MWSIFDDDLVNRNTSSSSSRGSVDRSVKRLVKKNFDKNLESEFIKQIFQISDKEEIPWRYDAFCAQTDPEAFFPEKGESLRDARTICFECPVQQKCLEYALENGERIGVWGGYSERELRALKRARREEETLKRDVSSVNVLADLEETLEDLTVRKKSGTKG